MAKAYKDVCPCKDCNVRTATCHSVCKEYKDWKNSGIEIKRKEKTDFINFGIHKRRKK